MSEMAELFIDCRLDLGEGPLWHPSRSELFWFDINAGDLYRANEAGEVLSVTHFGEPVSAAAVVDDAILMIASASAILRYDIAKKTWTKHIDLEAGNPRTRSNDSRVSPDGAWWIGTMGRKGETNAGKQYRYRDGKLSIIRPSVSIPNATCFSPDGKLAYFTDTPTRKILRVELDPATGLPIGDWEVFVDMSGGKPAPDGAVVDAEGFVWNAHYNGSRVVRYAPDGSVDRVVDLPCPHVTCPAFGGDDLKTLFITTAAQEMSADQLAAYPLSGSLFALKTDVPGQAETLIRL